MKLVIYPPAFGAPTASPFCVKAVCMMHAAKITWDAEISSDPRSAPKGKLPFLKDGNNVVSDSDDIRDYLEKTYKVDFDEGLSASDRAVSRAVIRMAEEHLYFALVCNRWLNDENWEVVKRTFFSGIPKLINGFVTKKIRAGAIASVKGQGSGLHSPVELAARASKDFDAIVTLLGEKPFLFGDAPTAADMSVVPILHAIASSKAKTPLAGLVQGNAALNAYVERGVVAMYP